MQPRQHTIATPHEQPPTPTKGPQSQGHHSSRTVLATNTHLKLQGCARKTLQPCNLETFPFRGLIPRLFAPSSSKAAELRAHKHSFLAALNLSYPQRNGQTYPRNLTSSRCNSVGVQTFLSIIFARKPMKHRLFQCPLPTSLNGKGIAPNRCRLNVTPRLLSTIPLLTTTIRQPVRSNCRHHHPLSLFPPQSRRSTMDVPPA